MARRSGTQKAGANTLAGNDNHWKRRPSEIRGYQRTYYCTTDSGDYLRVDYHLKEKRVRLYVEASGEGGNAYYSVITEGRITAEKSVSTGRSFGFADKFKEHAEDFLTLPNREIIKLIGGNYDIGWGKKRVEKKTEKEQRLEETKKRYFKAEDESEGGGPQSLAGRIFRINLLDMLDLVLGVAITAGAFFYYQYSLIVAGAVSACYGILTGLIDIFLRGRDPGFLKVFLFLAAGIAAYVYGMYL